MADTPTSQSENKRKSDVSPPPPSPAASPSRADSVPEDGETPASSRKKKKRTRVTQEQLARLESLFAAERSPTAARRREISDKLGMEERQTQVWFQNRRAKAKQSEGPKIANAKSSSGKPFTSDEEAPPTTMSGENGELEDVIHEPKRVTIVPCREVRVGTWARLSLEASKHDFIAYICEGDRRVSWFVHSSGCSVKMDIPFDIITDVTIASLSSNNTQVSLFLSHPPLFFLEERHTWRDGRTTRRWVRCADWTEGSQASSVLRHDVRGPTNPLTYLWHYISTYRRNVHLDTNSFNSSPRSAPLTHPVYTSQPQLHPRHPEHHPGSRLPQRSGPSPYLPIAAYSKGVRPITTALGYPSPFLMSAAPPHASLRGNAFPNQAEMSPSPTASPNTQISPNGAPRDIMSPMTDSFSPRRNKKTALAIPPRELQVQDGADQSHVDLACDPAHSPAFWSGRG